MAEQGESIWQKLAVLTGTQIPTRFTVSQAVHNIRIQAGGDRSAANADSITLLAQVVDALIEHIGAGEPGAPTEPPDKDVTGAALGQNPSALQKATAEDGVYVQTDQDKVAGEAKPTTAGSRD